VSPGRLKTRFTPSDVNTALGIDWAGTFLPKHRLGNPGGFTELFVRVDRGVYSLNEEAAGFGGQSLSLTGFYLPMFRFGSKRKTLRNFLDKVQTGAMLLFHLFD
jgi:hypothetical protein